MNRYSKAIVAFISLVVANETTILAVTNAVLPQGYAWLAPVLTTVLGTLAVYLKSNGKPAAAK